MSFVTRVPPLANIHTVAADGGADHTTIAGGLAAASSGDVVIVYHGNYAESVTIPAGVQLVGFPYCQSVVISGADATSARVVLSDDSTLSNISVIGPSSGANPAIDCNSVASSATLESVALNGDGGTGPAIHKTGAGTLLVRQISQLSGDFGGAFLDASAGVVDLLGGGITGIDGASSEFVKLTGTVKFQGHVITMTQAYSCTDGLYAGGTCDVQIANYMISEDTPAPTNAVRIASDGVTIDISDSHLHGSSYDILVDPALTGAGSTFNFSSGDFSLSKLSVPSSWDPDLFITGHIDTGGAGDDPNTNFTGDVVVGTAQFPSASSFGEGNSTVLGMEVFTFDGASTYVDVTSEANSPSGSTFTFPGLTVGDSIFFGWNYKPTFLNLEQTTAAVLGAGSIALSVWTGAAWSEIEFMVADSASAGDERAQYAKDIFLRADTSENIRFDTQGTTGTTLWDDWSTNAPGGSMSTLYWLQAEIVDASISTAPEFERARFGSNHVRNGTDGWAEYFGSCEKLRTFYSVAGGALSIPSGGANQAQDATVTFSTNVSYVLERSSFPDGTDTRRAGAPLPIPLGLDTSRPVYMEIEWYSDGADTNAVQWDLYVTECVLGSTLNADTVEQAVNTVSENGTGTAYQTQRSSFELYLSGMVPGDLIAFNLFRRGSTDANNDGAVILNYNWSGFFWN